MVSNDYNVVIQEITTTWDKKQWSGANAALRNAVPEVLELPLPNSASVKNSYLLHEANYRSEANFEQPYTTKLQVENTKNIITYKNHVIHLIEDRLELYFAYRKKPTVMRQYYMDATKNYFPELQGVFKLQPGEWVQFLYNARYRSYPEDGSITWYEKWVINIGIFAELHPRVLLDQKPKKVLSRLKQII